MLLNIKAFQQEEVMNKFLDKVFDERFTKLVENKVLDYILTIPNNTSKKINFNEYATQYLIAHYPQYNTMILPYESISVNDFPSRKPQKTIR